MVPPRTQASWSSIGTVGTTPCSLGVGRNVPLQKLITASLQEFHRTESLPAPCLCPCDEMVEAKRIVRLLLSPRHLLLLLLRQARSPLHCLHPLARTRVEV